MTEQKNNLDNQERIVVQENAYFRHWYLDTGYHRPHQWI